MVRPFFVALVLGAASALAFAPFDLWPLLPLAFALLCELVARARSLRSALALGWGFGVGQFCVGLNWIATAFTFQAAMPASLGWVAVVLVSLYLAIYPMLAVGLAWKWGAAKARPGDGPAPHGRERRVALVLALAGGWAICEWLRATMFTGFAWNPAGVALVDTPWRQVSHVIGTYGLSMLVVLGGGALWLAARRELRAAVGVASALGLVLLLPRPDSPAAPGLKVFDATEASDDARGAEPPRKIRIVQPNIGQQDKWREGFSSVAAERLNAMSGPRDGRGELIFWPEAAVTDPLADNRAIAGPYVESERQRATRMLGSGDLLLTGGLAFSSSDGRTVDAAANSVFGLIAGGNQIGRYDKAHLVPFGEYLPMRPILSAIGLSRLVPGDLDFVPGPGPRSVALPFGWGKVGFQICYEIIFSGEVVNRADRPDFLFNPSNDAWFGRWGPPQHLAQARLRAAEEGIPVIRSTPTGISAVVDASGALLHSLPWQQAGVIEADLPHPVAPGLFARFGNVVPLALGFALLLSAIALTRRRRYKRT